MKIIHISFSLLNGGKENMLVDIANQQKLLGHETAIIIINKKIEPSIEKRVNKNVKLYKLNRIPRHISIIPFIKLFLIINLCFKADVLHCHDVNLGKLLHIFPPMSKILTIHGLEIDISSMHNFQKLFAISVSVKSDVENRSNLKCQVIYNGITTNQIKQKNAYLKKGSFNIIQVGRLNHERKGQDILIMALHNIIYKLNIRNIQLCFVGEGESRAYIEQMISNLNLQNYITLAGNKNREWIYDHLTNYDLFVQPSRYEGFGLSVAEAMAAKLPVIASNIEGLTEILKNGEYGFIFENENVDDLVEKILYIMTLYKTGKIEKYVIKARDYCLKNYDIKITAKNYCENYL